MSQQTLVDMGPAKVVITFHLWRNQERWDSNKISALLIARQLTLLRL